MTITEPAKAYLGKDGIPWYATTADFDTRWDAERTYPFYEDEDAIGLFGFGHIDKDEFAKQVNEYDQLCLGYDTPLGDQYTAEDVIHCWAVLIRPREQGIQFSWLGVDSRTLGSWPLTRIVR